MTAARSTLATVLFLGVALIMGGCKSAPAPGVRNSDGSITNADGSITYPAGTSPAPAAPVQVATRNADGSTTNPDGSVTYPAGVKPTPSARQPGQSANVRPEDRRDERGEARRDDRAPVQDMNRQDQGRGDHNNSQAQQPQARVVRVVASGTPVTVSITETLSASHNEIGDRFSGSLQRPLTGADGVEVFPRGTPVAGVIAASKGKGRFKGAGDLAIELTSVGGTRVSATEYEAVGKGRGKRSAEVTGGGAGLGALIGGLAGGGKGALIGGLAGAGAGAAGAAYSGSRDVVIPSESTVTFTLTAPLSR